MKNATTLLDFYVKELKSTGYFDDVKFVHTGKVRPAEFPLESFIVACGVGGVSVQNSDSNQSVEKITLHLDAYAPSDVSKRELSLICQTVAEKLCKISGDYFQEAVEISEAVYESNLCTWRQQIRLKLSKQRQNGQGERLFVNAQPIDSLRSFEQVYSMELCEVKEYLSGTTAFSRGEQEEYLLVSISSDTDIFGRESFDLYCELQDVTYKGCKAVKARRKTTGNTGVYREYTLVFEGKVQGKGGQNDG